MRAAIGEVQWGRIKEVPMPTGAGWATADTSEQNLERLIRIVLTDGPCEPPKADGVREACCTHGGDTC